MSFKDHVTKYCEEHECNDCAIRVPCDSVSGGVPKFFNKEQLIMMEHAIGLHMKDISRHLNDMAYIMLETSRDRLKEFKK